MTRLYELRKRLVRLRRRRWRTRVATAYSGLLLAVLWILAAAFLVDWLFEMNRTQRLISLLLCAAVAVRAFRRYVLPWLGQREDDLDMALLVERAHRIDSDLVAAMQFEWPQAPEWGSPHLEQAVIEGAVRTAQRLNVMQGFSRRELNRRLALLAATALVWAIVGFSFPGHVAAFFNRFFLGAMHYPTQTIIESITVNGQKVDPRFPGSTVVHSLYGEPVVFEARCSGVVPTIGRAALEAPHSSLQTSVTLKPVPDRDGVFRGELPRLIEPVRYQLHLGDAWTDPGLVSVSALPVVDVELEVHPPSYTAEKDARPVVMPTGLRQVSVMEGSRVVVRLHSDKPLERATLSIDDQPYGFRRVAAATGDGNREQWALDSDDSPLFSVTDSIRYAIQVTDTEGQQLERPIEGLVRIQADAPPRIAAGIITRFVLPKAKPTVYFRAIDDYGLARVVAAREVVRPDGKTVKDELEVYTLPPGQKPVRNLEQGYVLDLGLLSLAKGDVVKITMQAIDFRGKREGKSATADTLVFQVTDEQGILANMMEADRESARQLQTMIQRQLGIGESP